MNIFEIVLFSNSKVLYLYGIGRYVSILSSRRRKKFTNTFLSTSNNDVVYCEVAIKLTIEKKTNLLNVQLER